MGRESIIYVNVLWSPRGVGGGFGCGERVRVRGEGEVSEHGPGKERVLMDKYKENEYVL